jgi:hypothetical protein
VAIGEQARSAYSAVFASGAPGVRAFEIEVSAARGDVSPSPTGWRAAVEHVVVVRAAAGGEPGRWVVGGEAWILGTREEDLRAAFMRAATNAATTFEAELRSADAVAEWLSTRGVALPGDAARSGRRDDWTAVVFVESGLAVAWYRGEPHGAAMARSGVSSNWLAVALTAEMATFPFDDLHSVAWRHDGKLRVSSLGVDLALVRRTPGSAGSVEVWAGGGAARVAGEVEYKRFTLSRPETTNTESAWSPSVFATVQHTGRVRFLNVRWGAEVRRRFGPTFEFETVGGKADLGMTSVRLFVGVEFPLVRRIP